VSRRRAEPVSWATISGVDPDGDLAFCERLLTEVSCARFGPVYSDPPLRARCADACARVLLCRTVRHLEDDQRVRGVSAWPLRHFRRVGSSETPRALVPTLMTQRSIVRRQYLGSLSSRCLGSALSSVGAGVFTKSGAVFPRFVGSCPRRSAASSSRALLENVGGMLAYAERADAEGRLQKSARISITSGSNLLLLAFAWHGRVASPPHRPFPAPPARRATVARSSPRVSVRFVLALHSFNILQGRCGDSSAALLPCRRPR